MSAVRAMPPSAEILLLLGLGFVAVIAAMIPLGPGGTLMSPDLLYCLCVAWAIRHPGRVPLWAVVALGLFADLMLSRPIGLGALGLMLAVEAFRSQALLFHGTPFVLEWAAAILGFALLLAGMHLALELVFVPAPGLMPSARHLLATAIAYPLVVLGLGWCLGIRPPRGSRGPGRLP